MIGRKRQVCAQVRCSGKRETERLEVADLSDVVLMCQMGAGESLVGFLWAWLGN